MGGQGPSALVSPSNKEADPASASTRNLSRVQLNWGLYEQFLLIDVNPTEAAVSTVTLDAKLRSCSVDLDTKNCLCSFPSSTSSTAVSNTISGKDPLLVSYPALAECAAYKKLQEARSAYMSADEAHALALKDPGLAEGDKNKWKRIIDLFGNFYALNTSFALPSPSSTEGVLSRSQSCKREGTDSPTPSHLDSSSSSSSLSSSSADSPSTQTATGVSASAHASLEGPARAFSPSFSNAGTSHSRGGSQNTSSDSAMMSSSQSASAMSSSSLHKMPPSPHATASSSPGGGTRSGPSLSPPGSLQRKSSPFLDNLREKPSLDLKRLDDFYTAIHAAGRSAASHGFDALGAILDKIRTLCDGIQNHMEWIAYPCQLRFILVLLGCPFYEEGEGDLLPLLELVRTVSMLPEEPRQTLVRWYETLPLPYLRSHLVNVQQLITLRLLSYPDMNTIRDVFAAPLRHALHTLHILYVAWNRRQNEQRRSLRESQKLWGEKRFLLSGIRESLVRGSSHDTSDSSDFPVGVGGGEVSGGTPSDFLSLEDRGVSVEKHQGGEKEEERERTRKRKAEEAHDTHHDLVHQHGSTPSSPIEVEEEMGNESSAPVKYEEFQNDAINSQHQHLLFRYDLAQWIEWRGRKARNAARRAGGRGRPKRRGRGEDDRAGKTSGGASGRGENRQEGQDDEAEETSREDEENDDGDEDVDVTTLGGLARRFFGERRARRNEEEEEREDNEDARHNNDMEGEVESKEEDNSHKDESSNTSSNTTDERRRNGRERNSNGKGSTESEKGKEENNHSNSNNNTSLVFHHDILPNRSQFKEETDFALLQHPFILDAAIKAVALKQHAAIEQFQQARQVELDALFSLLSGQVASDRNPFLDITVRRDHIVQDTLYEIDRRSRTRNALKKALKVKFAGEEGVDEGGVKKEFFQLLVQELFSPGYDMFLHYEDSRLCWFNPVSTEEASNFRLIGVIFGLAIYNGVLLDVRFPSVIFRKLLGWFSSSIEDLEELQPSVARSLRALLYASEKELEDMELTFSVELDRYGDRVEVPLGDHAVTDKVTIDNRDEYIELYVDYALNKSVESQYTPFHEGFHLCVDEPTISLFRPEELQQVILGSEEELDFGKLKTATSYQDGYTEDSETVKDFWAIADSLDGEQKKKLLMFVTGSDRVPIKGLSSLKFIIGRNGSDSDRLPTAHTCFNYILLPDYKNREKLDRLLKIAIENCHGFGLR